MSALAFLDQDLEQLAGHDGVHREENFRPDSTFKF